MQPLPIDPVLPEIASAVKQHRTLVLIAPPGSGKTTRVPPALLEAVAGLGRVVVLQPRRIAARAAAVRIASERGWVVGGKIGYQVRFENRTCADTRLEVVTEGILTRRLQNDPSLEGTAVVVLDEFHERSIHADLALAILREVRANLRPELAVVVMSATMDPGPVASFLGGAPVVSCGGRPHPVELRYSTQPDRSRAHEAAARAVRDAWDESKGHVLVFLPGIGEIRRTAESLERFAQSKNACLTPLHGSLSLDEQEKALAPLARRKIILATNVAETSLTIDGVDLVIDSGLARILRNDPRHGIDRLEVTRISKHSAEQRSGRAGRLGPGRAVRLWTRAEHSTLAEAEEPEILRIDLASTVLELRAWGISDPAKFGWFEAPDPNALVRAEELLESLGAVERKNGPLTPAGKAMLSIPAHPRLSRMLVAAHAEGVLEDGAALAALIEERDIIPVSPERPYARGDSGSATESGPSDLLARLDLLVEAEQADFRREACQKLGVDASAARAVARARDALLRSTLKALGPAARASRGKLSQPIGDEDALLRVVLHGYPDRVVRRRATSGDRGRMTGGRGVVLTRESIVRDHELFLAVELDENARGERLEAKVRIASAVRRAWVEEAFPEQIVERVETTFDAASERVRSTASVYYRDLPLEEPREMQPAPDVAQRTFAEAVRERAAEIVSKDEDASAWLRRVRWLREWMPELELPPFEGAELGETLAAACPGVTSFAELRAAGIVGCLRSRLSPVQEAALRRCAPESIRVPTGNDIRLVYEPGRPPILAVRLQELFGIAETPKVASGRVPVLLHLLGPNFRPVQVTQDLRSFWSTTYAQVRKDLRARYPKHAWPEDPWTAAPQAGPTRRRSSRGDQR